MAGLEFYLDEMPGETRAVVTQNGEVHSLYIERDTDRFENRLGTQLVGRVARVEPGLKAAFIDTGAGEPFGFMSLPKAVHLTEGQKVRVQVSAEIRESKGPALKYLGEGQGDARILSAGPGVTQILRELAGSEEIITGLKAVEMSLHAEEEARNTSITRSDVGLDLAIQRTRALIAADIDYAPLPGRDSRKGRDAVNRFGLNEVARQLRLKHWGGIVAIDLAGVAFQGDSIVNLAKAVFSGWNGVAIGPLSRFGLLQVSVPWSHTPLDERLAHRDTVLLDSVRRLHHALLSDRATPVYELVCGAESAKRLAPLVAALGPRARLSADGPAGAFTIKQG
ncbi:ribonuclease E/G [Brevundimonas sp.]|uniref:ribonuclease E/G n=1 Tax=Brevundimonas sp. TaxID=1871086 RepID=UPI002FC9A337